MSSSRSDTAESIDGIDSTSIDGIDSTLGRTVGLGSGGGSSAGTSARRATAGDGVTSRSAAAEDGRAGCVPPYASRLRSAAGTAATSSCQVA
jgi:hypothetical protein